MTSIIPYQNPETKVVFKRDKRDKRDKVQFAQPMKNFFRLHQLPGCPQYPCTTMATCEECQEPVKFISHFVCHSTDKINIMNRYIFITPLDCKCGKWFIEIEYVGNDHLVRVI